MSAVLTPRRTRRGRERDRDTGRSGAPQESLFGSDAAPVETTGSRASRSPSRARRYGRGDGDPLAISGPTLDDLVSGLWGDLLAGEAATCPACGAEPCSHATRPAPAWSAAAAALRGDARLTRLAHARVASNSLTP